MGIRNATADDWHVIRDVAERSFQASYSLSPDEISMILEQVFTEDALRERIAAPDVLVLVAETSADDSVVGFAEVELGHGGTLRWLHVHPDGRGQGVGTALVDRVRSELDATDQAPLTARVMDAAVEGGEFLEKFGLYADGNATYELDGEQFAEQVHTEDGQGQRANEPEIEVPETVEVDSDQLQVQRDDPIPGRDAPFFRVFDPNSTAERYGYLCSNCASTDIAADGLDRLECGDCGNEHLADEWDDAYL